MIKIQAQQQYSPKQTKNVALNTNLQPQSSPVNAQLSKSLQHGNLMFGSMKPVLNSINTSTIPVVPKDIPSLTTLDSQQNTTDLSGDWKYFLGDELPKKNDSETGIMNLPSNWFFEGKEKFPEKFRVDETKPFDIKTGKPDPGKGLNYSGTVLYKKDIELKEAPDPNKPYFLDLDMVDYYGQVYLNGKPVGEEHKGYFQNWSRNLTEAKDENGKPLLKQGKNEILIKVSDPNLPFDNFGMLNGQIIKEGEETQAQKESASFPRRQDKVGGVLKFNDVRPGANNGQEGQECSTGGIIRGIKLRQSSGLDILSTKITPGFDPAKVSTEGADIKMQFKVTNLTDKPKEIVLSGEISPHNFKEQGKTDEAQKQKFSKTVTIPPHETMDIKHSEHVNNPKLWWTRDKGYPHLYQSTVKIEEAGEDGNSKPLDQKLNVFGIRSITRDENTVHYLNGKRFYPRGINELDQYLAKSGKDWSQRDINLIKGANLNSVLVHAHLHRPEFYDLCDREGIAVVQGFPLIWTYTENPEFTKNAESQAKDMVDRYGGHPSIIEWIAHNEGSKTPELDDKISKAISSNDSEKRPIIENSGE
ncbi:MAG: glycoside hydrolase family 2 TIM barrel-domain containing protein, partial [Candidatus Gastranaerophilaceae bacterium]